MSAQSPQPLSDGFVKSQSRPVESIPNRVVFVINSIGSGGAERVLDTLIRMAPPSMATDEFHLVLLDDEPDMRVLPDRLHRHCLNAQGSLLRAARGLARLLPRLRPTLVVSFLVRANIATALVAPHRTRAVILCERMHLSSHLRGRYRWKHLAVLHGLIRSLYWRADRVLAVSEGVRTDLIKTFGLATDMVTTIENPYDIDALVAASAERATIDLPSEFIVAVGRLVAAKGFSDLIKAYAHASPDWPLIILGVGPELAALVEETRRWGIADRVQFLGFVANPFSIMARAQFLVSASRNEGFPNAIAEAMALGIPVLATDCPSGPAELLCGIATQEGKVVETDYGLLVPVNDVLALKRGIVLMKGDAQLRRKLGAAGRRRLESFRAAPISARYWAIFEGLMGGKAMRRSIARNSRT